ncbi:hypothetical protein J4E91_011232 [Alternaria rosae]|nr:hypothetical protein J4E91_011232 [Alternaria rosae]
MQDQIRDLTAENTMIFAGKDAAIAELKHEVHELRIQNKGLSCSLKEETNNRKLAVVCAENLTRQYDIQGKEVVTLNDRVTELEGELAGEKAKNVADKGANESHKPRSTAHAAAARSSLTALTKDLRAQERQVLSLSSALDSERAEHEKHLEDLEATHARELVAVNKEHTHQFAEVEVHHSQELIRVKLWCVMNSPRANELSRVLERQRRLALEAEAEKMKEEAEVRHAWQEARIQELERENDQVKHQLASMQEYSRCRRSTRREVREDDNVIMPARPPSETNSNPED